MSAPEDIERVVEILRKVPEKKLLIIELANTIPIKYGTFDPAVVSDRAPEINLAIEEAKVYGSRTIMAVEDLIRVKAAREV